MFKLAYTCLYWGLITLLVIAGVAMALTLVGAFVYFAIYAWMSVLGLISG